MRSAPLKILFLCTGNSARSIMAEAIVNGLGGERFVAHSAGSRPAAVVDPHALEVLNDHGHATAALNSKSWDVFAADDALVFDIVITVCDNAAGESCPLWPGQPLTVHWGIPDPAAATGSATAVRRAFDAAYGALSARITRLLELPLESMSNAERRAALDAIHEGQGPG